MPSSRASAKVTVREAHDLIAAMLDPDLRRRLLESMQAPEGLEASLARLRRAMRSHVFPTDRETHSLARVVQALDHRTKAEGFHVLSSWDYVAHKFADQIVPVLMLDRCAAYDANRDQTDAVLSTLLDQYFLSVLGLLLVRAWEDSHPDAVFDDVTRLLMMLGGPSHRFVDDAATLLLLAVSHYHPHEAAYGTLIDRIATLDDEHRLNFALACAPVLGGHFRWGLRFMYKRDFGSLRDDNVVDYPWLSLAMRTLTDAYCGTTNTPARRAAIVEGLLNGVSADPWAFTGATPRCLRGGHLERDHDFVRAALHERRNDLLNDFEALRPHPTVYSPLGLEVNFLCNALVAMVATAVATGEAHPSLDALLASGPMRNVPEGGSLEQYARSLMAYASGGGSAELPALIVYDPQDAQRAFNLTMQVLRDA
jgi:hypothetical protein